MTAFQERLDAYRSQNVQVLGISTDDSAELAKFAADIGIEFPLLCDKGGTVSKKFGFYDNKKQRSSRAVAAIADGQLLYSGKVTTTRIPSRLLPWVESVSDG